MMARVPAIQHLPFKLSPEYASAPSPLGIVVLLVVELGLMGFHRSPPVVRALSGVWRRGLEAYIGTDLVNRFRFCFRAAIILSARDYLLLIIQFILTLGCPSL